MLLADGDTFAIHSGATWRLSRSMRLGVELFYSPLSVVRPGQDREDDSLFHLRALLRYRWR